MAVAGEIAGVSRLKTDREALELAAAFIFYADGWLRHSDELNEIIDYLGWRISWRCAALVRSDNSFVPDPFDE